MSSHLNIFSMEMLKRLSAEGSTGNLFICPNSNYIMLLLLLMGAEGETFNQIMKVMLGDDEERVKKAKGEQTKSQLMKELMAKFSPMLKEQNKKSASMEVIQAAKVYVEQSYKICQSYTDILKEIYIPLESVDFITSPKKARDSINNWMTETTKGTIKDTLTEHDIDSKTRMMLLDTLYFYGKWKNPFNKALTFDTQFRISKREKRTVKMMRQTGIFSYSFIPEIKCKVLVLPYDSEDMSMIIMLPEDIEDETTGLEKLKKELNAETFEKWTDPKTLTKRQLQVMLPRFKLESFYHLEKFLISEGIVDAFNPATCDFSGISPCKDLVLSKVLHKTVMEVNEEGTEVGGATVAELTLGSSREQIELIADHPFLFFIQHNPTLDIVYVGLFSSP